MLPPVKKSISCCQSPPTYCWKLFKTAFACKQCLICGYFSPDSGFFTGNKNIMDRSKKKSLKKREKFSSVLMDCFFLQTQSFSLHKMLIDGLEWCGLLVDYWGVFIKCLDSHSDGTHSLQGIHWWASDVITISIGWPGVEYIFSKFSFLGELLL